MFAKFGLILLVLLATVLAFVAGTMLHGEASPTSSVPSVSEQNAAATAPPATTTDTAQPGGATSPGKDTAATDKPIPYTDLTLPNVLPPEAELVLQVGLFLDTAQTRPLAERLTALGQSSQLLQVTDPNGQPWTLLVAGPYTSLDEARSQRQAVRRGLALHHAPALLMLPPKKQPDGS